MLARPNTRNVVNVAAFDFSNPTGIEMMETIDASIGGMLSTILP